MGEKTAIRALGYLLDEAFRGAGIEDSNESQAAELDVPRMTNWGELRTTRWIVAAMITHDAYHAGEINHLRSILGTDDRWRFIQLGFG